MNYKAYPFIILLFISFNFFAQISDSTQISPIDMTGWNLEIAKKNYPEKILTIIADWEKGKNSQSKAKALTALIKEMRGIDPKGTFYFTNELLEIGEALNSDTIIFNAKRFVGLVYAELGDFQSAHISLSEALTFAEKTAFKHGMAEANSLLSANYHLLGNNEKGILTGKKGLKLYQELNGESGIAAANHNLGSCYLGMGQFEKAIKHFIDALKTYEKIDEHFNLRVLHYNLGACYLNLGKFSEAETHANKCLALTDEGKYPHIQSGAFNVLGSIHLVNNRLDKAKSYFLKSIEGYQLTNSIGHLATVYSNLGAIYLRLNLPDSCIYWNKQAEVIGNQLNLTEVLLPAYSNFAAAYANLNQWEKSDRYYQKCIEICEGAKNENCLKQMYLAMSIAQEEKGDFEKAYRYHQQYNEKENAILSLENQKQIEELKIAYETEKTERELIQQKQKTTQRTAVAIGLLLLLGLLYYRFLVTKKNKTIAEKNAALLLSQNAELQEKLISPEAFLQKSITLTNKDRTVLPLKNILYIQSERNAVRIITNDKKIWEWQHLKTLKEILPENVFIQTHRSYLVNSFEVRGKKAQSLTMSNGDIVKIGNTLKEKVHQFLASQELPITEKIQS